MGYEGGYTSAVNSITNRQQQEAQTAALLQSLAQQKQQYEQQQAAQARAMQARAMLGSMLPQLAQLGRPPEDGAQPPAPGQPSVPMQPPQAGSSPMGPPGAQSAPNPAGMFLTRPPVGAGAPPSPSGAPPGAMPPGVGAAPPAGPPGGPVADSWRPMPPAAPPPPGAPGQISAPPAPKEDAVMPRQMIGVADLAKLLKAKGIEGSAALDMIDQWKPYMDSQNKQELDGMKIQFQAQKAATEAYKATVARMESERKGTQGDRKLGQADTRIEQNAPLIQAKTAAANALAGKRSGTGGSAAPESGLSEAAISTAAEQFNATGVMPWLGKMTGSARTAIMNKAAELREASGADPGSIVGNRADVKASQGALNAITKDLASIRPYKVMLDKNGDIAIDLAKKAIATDAKLANRPINWIRQNATDNPDVAEFLAQAQIVSTEAARVLNNPRLVGQLTDSARHEMQEIINGNMPLNAFTRVVERMKKDGENRTKAMEDEAKELRTKIGGKASAAPGGGKVAPPEALKYLKDHPETKAKFQETFGYLPAEM